MANLQNKKKTIKVDGVDNVYVLNKPDARSEDYAEELGGILLIAKYKTYIDKEVVTPALDMGLYTEFARPLRAFQDLIATRNVLRQIEKEPLRPGKAAKEYTLKTLHERTPRTVKLDGEHADGNGVMLVAKQAYTGEILAKILVGPRGGLKYELADIDKMLERIYANIDGFSKKMIDQTTQGAPADIGEAYSALFNCIVEGKKVPEKVGRTVIKLTEGLDGKVTAHIMAGDKEVGTLGPCEGGAKSRTLSMAYLADLVIPEAATTQVMLTRK